MNSMAQIAINSFCIGLGVTLLHFWTSSRRKGSSFADKKPKILQSFAVPGKPDRILKAIVKHAEESGYTTDFVDEATGRVVLGEPTTISKPGYFFPVFVTRQVGGETLVEVGIKSKLGAEFGPIVARHLKRVSASIRDAAMSAESQKWSARSASVAKRKTDRLEWKDGQWAQGEAE